MDFDPKLNESAYDGPRNWIINARKHGWDWDTIRRKSEESAFIKNNINENWWPDDSLLVWKKLVDQIEIEDNKRREMRDGIGRGTIASDMETNVLEVPQRAESSWQKYKAQLLQKMNPDDVMRVEEECRNILNHLSRETQPDFPVRGLVVGNVQSGKTSNMAGVMAMAADHGWNMFIVLSGMIENLRMQTENRLDRDLRCTHPDLCWNKIYPDRLEPMAKLSLREGVSERYFLVTLKRKEYLKPILQWLNGDLKQKKLLKILVIDDEADQASANSVNLKKYERRVINDLVVKIVNCESLNDGPIEPYGCMNYLAYTATPYANFLSDSTVEGLFPRSFVTLLTPPNTYIGSRELFGSVRNPDYGGMWIVHHEEKYGDPEKDIKPVHKANYSEILDGSVQIPIALKKAVCWFICSVCALRLRGHGRPKTMLIHTSLDTGAHKNVAAAIKYFLSNNKDEVKSICHQVYAEETQYDLNAFREDLPTYGAIESIEPYPKFEEISNSIDELLDYKIDQMAMDEDRVVFSNGINLCIDNSKETVLDEEEQTKKYHPRLIYPEPGTSDFDEKGLAFIVIGGNTISRGLTLEGLIASYFARMSSQGDTLIQMSRWFGYRLGYELYPRIWMSQTTYEDFCDLTSIDEEMREFIRNNYSALSPEQYPPRVRKFPGARRIKKMTSKDSAAIDDGYDFRGTLTEVTVFERSDNIIQRNELHTKEFIRSMTEKPIPNKGCLVWKGVKQQAINQYLRSMEISRGARNYEDIEQLLKWIKQQVSSDWNVVLAGTLSSEQPMWPDVESGVCRVVRSARFIREERDGITTMHIGSLSTARDRYADIIYDDLDQNAKDEYVNLERNTSSGRFIDMRSNPKFGVTDNPLLMIYPIDGSSKPGNSRGKSNSRFPLGCRSDQTIIGLAIVIPGSAYNKDDPSRYKTIMPETKVDQ